MEKIDENKFVDLVDKHQNLVHKICKLYTNSIAEHKDLFQEIKDLCHSKNIYIIGQKKKGLVEFCGFNNERTNVLNSIEI